MEFWESLNEEKLHKALDLFNNAVKLEPEWAPPYAGIAFTWAGLSQMLLVSPEEARQKIYKNLNKALELDPDFHGAHFTKAVVSAWVDWNWEEAEKEFLKALVINPNDIKSRIYYSHLLIILSRTEEALEQGRIAVELDPYNDLVLALYSVVLQSAGRYSEGKIYAEKAVSINPDSFFARHRLKVLLNCLGKYEKAFEIEKDHMPFNKETINRIDSVFRTEGRVAAYEIMIEEYEKARLKQYISPLLLAELYHEIKDYENAIKWLKKAYEIREPNMPYINTYVNGLQNLSEHPDFIAIINKMNLPPE